MADREMLRFKWDQRHPVHRAVVKRVNSALAKVPLERKYALTRQLVGHRPPHSVVGPGDTVVEVGAPSDTLHSGRSRGMHLSLRSTSGHALIVEPDPSCAEEFSRCAKQLGLDHVAVVNSGAWNAPSTLSLLVDPKHPATNFVAGTVDYDPARVADFTAVEVPVDTLDSIVERTLGSLRPICVLSITTNNSEQEILQGIQGIIDAGLQHLCLARTGAGYDRLAGDLGFDFLCADDRGCTYLRRR